MNAPRLYGDPTIGANQDMVRTAIGRAAQRTGVDFSYLLNQAKSESGLNPNARASTSSASGLFQFIDQSWLGVMKQHGAKHGMGWAANAIDRTSGGQWVVRDPQMRQAVFALRNQPEASALMAAESASENAAGLSQALGRPANATDLYFAHFLGPAGAARYLKAHQSNPGATAAALFPREAAVNQSLFYTRSGEARSLDDLYALMGRKISGGGDSGGVAPVSTDPMAAMRMARAGDLVPVPEGSPDGDLASVLAQADMPYGQPSTTEENGSSEAMMAMLERRGGINMMRPSPETARLAYLMLATDLDEKTTSDGTSSL